MDEIMRLAIVVLVCAGLPFAAFAQQAGSSARGYIGVAVNCASIDSTL